MSLSITCIEQQQKDRRTVKKFVIYGLLCSTILHVGVLTLAISGMLDRPLEQEEDAIELIFVEEPEEAPPEPEVEEKVEEPEPEEIVEEQEVIPPEPVETAIAQPQEIVPPEIPTETAISETVEPSSPEQLTETALEPIEQPQQLEPLPEPEPVVAEPITQPNPSAAAFSPDSIAEVQPDSASTPETSDSFSAPIAANIPPEVPKPEVAVTQPSFEEPSLNLSSSLGEQSDFEDVSSDIGQLENSLSSPIETERSVPTRPPAAVGTQPSVNPTNSNIGSSLSEESSFGDVATNSANPGNSNSQFGSPLSSDNTGEGSRPSLPGEVGTQPNASGQSNSGIGDALSRLGNFEDGSSRNSDNPGSGELAAVRSPLQGFGGSRGRPTKPSSGSGSGSSSGSGSGGVSCIDCPQPDYPSLAREEGLEGNPKLRIDIDFDGNVTNVYIEKSSGHSILDEAAMEAVKEWKLDPKDGGRLGVLVTLKFRLR